MRIFGGYQILNGDLNGSPASISTTFNNLPPHYAVTISMKIYKIDSWQNEHLFVMVDGITRNMYTWGVGTGTIDICGNPNPIISALNPQFNELIIDYNQTIQHSAPTLTLKMISSLNSWTGSWGIRQLTVSVERCSLSCLSCDSSLSCLSCDVGLNIVGQYCQCANAGDRRLIQKNCITSSCVSCATTCFPGYYPLNITQCAACHIACAVCTGPTNTGTDCSQCAIGYTLGSGATLCQKCYGTCSACTGLGFNQCTACVYGSFLLNNQCLSFCPARYYASQSNRICIACISPCKQCQGSANGYCLSCLPGQYLYNQICYTTCPFSLFGYNSICVSSCPLSTYADLTFICQNCPRQQCLTCNSLAQCILCRVNTFYHTNDVLCYSSCPATYYGDSGGAVCVKCDKQCLTCNGPSNSQCQSCNPGTYLVYSSCYSVCPPHTYATNCLLCHDNCLNCTGNTQFQCSACFDGYFLHLNQSSCAQYCYEGDITDNALVSCFTCQKGKVGYFGSCVDCYPSCMSCNNTYFSDCSQCIDIHPVTLQNIIQYKGYCIYEGTSIIYMPNLEDSSYFVYNALLITMLVNLGLALILQCLFKYKTNLLLVIEYMQILSYIYYLSSPLSRSTQQILLLLYNAHPSAIFNLQNILATPISDIPHPRQQDILVKAQMLGKSGIFLLDSLYFHVIIILCILIYGVTRVCHGYLYHKINPYIISYGYRLLFMQHVFCIMLFLIYLDLSHQLLIWSLVVCIIDVLIIGMSFFWKIRTDTELDHSHYALFYFNQLGPPATQTQLQLNDNQRNDNLRIDNLRNDNQSNDNQRKHKKSILPSLIFYFGKLPYVILIFFFSQQPTTQSICLLAYTILISGINLVIQYRRKIVKYMSYFYHASLVMAAIFVLLLNCNIDVAKYFDYFILVSMCVILAVTFIQLIANYMLFFSVYYYSKQKLIECCKNRDK